MVRRLLLFDVRFVAAPQDGDIVVTAAAEIEKYRRWFTEMMAMARDFLAGKAVPSVGSPTKEDVKEHLAALVEQCETPERRVLVKRPVR